MTTYFYKHQSPTWKQLIAYQDSNNQKKGVGSVAGVAIKQQTGNPWFFKFFFKIIITFFFFVFCFVFVVLFLFDLFAFFIAVDTEIETRRNAAGRHWRGVAGDAFNARSDGFARVFIF